MKTEKDFGIFWAAIRQGESGEWVASNEIGVTREGAYQSAKVTDQMIPAWAAEHLVQRVARVRLIEASTED